MFSEHDRLESFFCNGQACRLLFPDTSNIFSHLRRIVSGEEYPVLPTLRPDFVIDLGANVGAAALYFGTLYPDAQIASFEPSPSNYRYLVENVGHFPHIKTFNIGLLDEVRESHLFLGENHCLQHSIVPSNNVGEKFEVVNLQRALFVLQDIVRGRGVLKLDTEGCEVPILRDISGLLSFVDVVYVEYHSERDRREIDHLLCEAFSLWRAKAEACHRGNFVYLSKQLLQERPELERRKIVFAP